MGTWAWKYMLVSYSVNSLDSFDLCQIHLYLFMAQHKIILFPEPNIEDTCETKVWLILILMITKQSLEWMIIFQVWLGKTISKVTITKTNQAKDKSWRRRPPQREEFFKNPSFIRSLCKVVGALGLSCISFFIYAPKSSKSNIVLNIFRIGWFHVFN